MASEAFHVEIDQESYEEAEKKLLELHKIASEINIYTEDRHRIYLIASLLFILGLLTGLGMAWAYFCL